MSSMNKFMVNVKLKLNHEYKFIFGLYDSCYGIVLSQNENWIKIRYCREVFYDGKVSMINLENVNVFREV